MKGDKERKAALEICSKTEIGLSRERERRDQRDVFGQIVVEIRVPLAQALAKECGVESENGRHPQVGFSHPD